MATVTLTELTKAFGDLTAVDSLDLEIEDGELLCLLGPSGCGKSTTLRMLGGLETPTDGDVYIGDEQVTDQPPYERDTSMVFQSWALFPHKTVLENVAFGPKMAGADEDERTERAREFLDIVEMGEFADHTPEELSGGQRQRVALARSLAVEPSVLLLDEPLSNLDKRLREQMQLELKEIHEAVETTFVHVTHDQNEAFTLADRIGIIDDGQIEQVGEPREVYDDPNNRFVEEFLGDTNFVSATISDVTSDGVVADTELGATVEVPVDGADDQVSVGDPLSLSVRPETVEIEKADVEREGRARRAAADGSLRGAVTDVLYRGSSVRYYVELGETDVFFERSVADDADIAVGDDVFVGWDPTDLLLFSGGDRIGGDSP